MERDELTYYEHPDITRALYYGGRYEDEICRGELCSSADEEIQRLLGRRWSA